MNQPTTQSPPSVLLDPSPTTGRIVVEFAAYVDFCLEFDLALEELVERYETQLEDSAPRSPA